MTISKIFRCVITKGMVLACVIFFAVSAPVTADDKICINENSTALLPTLDGEIESDQGWIGSNQYAFLNGSTGQHGRVQLKRKGSNLYVSFEIDKLPEFNANDVIILLVGPDLTDPTKDYRIHVYPGSNSGNGTDSQPRRIAVWKNTNASTSPTAIANWVQQINCEPTISPTTCSTSTSFVEAKVTAGYGASNDNLYRVEMRINAGATGLSLPAAGPDIKLAFNALRVYQVTSGGITDTVADQLNWPTNGNIPGGTYPLPGPNPLDDDIMANPLRANWGTASLAPSNQSCPGVQVKRAWINTTATSSTLAAPGPGASSVTNVFHVEVENTGTTDAGNVLGTISSWRFGSAPLSLYVNHGKIGPPNVGSVAPSNPVTSYSSTTPGPIGASQVTELQPMSWTLASSDYHNLYASYPNLCSLVELDVDTAHVPSGVQRTQIANRFYYWNIRMAPASVFKDKALLDSRGYARSARYPAEQKFELMVSTQQIAARTNNADIKKENATSLPSAQSQRLLELVGGLGYYREGAAFFVKTVCPYRHTGRYIDLNGQSVELMERAPCFEYWIHHIGELAGWTDRLNAVSDNKLVMNGDKHYSISMGFDKSVELETNIEAKEPVTVPPCKSPCGTIGCPKQAANDSDVISGSLILVGSLGVGGFAFLRRRRTRKSSVEHPED